MEHLYAAEYFFNYNHTTLGHYKSQLTYSIKFIYFLSPAQHYICFMTQKNPLKTQIIKALRGLLLKSAFLNFINYCGQWDLNPIKPFFDKALKYSKYSQTIDFKGFLSV